MLDLNQFIRYVAFPAMSSMGYASAPSLALVTGTCYAESGLKYVHQLGNGPALGLGQMEPATHDSLWENFLRYRTGLAQNILGSSALPLNKEGKVDPGLSSRLIWDMRYMLKMCRARYLDCKSPLPPLDAQALAEYHKQIYNTAGGAADVDVNTPKFQQVIDAIKAAGLNG